MYFIIELQKPCFRAGQCHDEGQIRFRQSVSAETLDQLASRLEVILLFGWFQWFPKAVLQKPVGVLLNFIGLDLGTFTVPNLRNIGITLVRAWVRYLTSIRNPLVKLFKFGAILEVGFYPGLKKPNFFPFQTNQSQFKPKPKVPGFLGKGKNFLTFWVIKGHTRVLLKGEFRGRNHPFSHFPSFLQEHPPVLGIRIPFL